MSILNNKNNSPIGFFDSGVGGLTVLKKVQQILPNENYIFYGDTLHVPYGDKTKEQLLKYSDNILKLFEKKGCKAVVMACNTTSSVVYDDLKNNYNFKLYPVVQSVAKILANLPVKKLGVFATKVTIESQAYQKEISKYNKNIKVFGQFCPQWVKIVENNLTNDTKSIEIIKKDLDEMLKNNPEKIILGCTHYPFLLDILSEFAPREMFIDPANYLAQFIKEDLGQSELISNNTNIKNIEFYASANPKAFQQAAKMFYDLDKEPQLLTF